MNSGPDRSLAPALVQWGAVSGIAGLCSYVGAAFIPLPDLAGYGLVFFMGPLLALSFVGVHAALAAHRDSVTARFGMVLGIVAGGIVNIMLVIQGANNILRARGADSAMSEADRETAELVWRAVNRVQFSIDVSWDFFITLAGILLGIAMLSHPKFGKLFGWSGIVLGALLLSLNMWTFPIPPAEAGSIDLGPLVALWFLAVFIRMLTLRGWLREG
ncbi:MAG: hypothetical protein JSU87_03320 [Gemmatimonadota bacterium]|nr:MAG: hypothetical protein JSU87_03320 [Gemmatimonadota bacterium]